jgi:transcriptional regulator with XRE-family HTH domain
MDFKRCLKEARKRHDLKMKEVAARTGIDQALISKFEYGKRMPTEQQLRALIQCYELSEEQIRPLWLAEKLYDIIRDERLALEALAVAESRIEYLRSRGVLQLQKITGELKEQLKRIDELKDTWTVNRPLNATQLGNIFG